MPLTDLPLDQARRYRSTATEPADFDAFWRRTLDEAALVPLEPVLQPVAGFWRTVDVWDVLFLGAGGTPVHAWLTAPKDRQERLPGVVEFVGYGGGRGLPGEQQHWAAAGFAHLLMDTRGQGGAWGTGGDTADPAGTESGAPGSMTRGILDPDHYYYRRVFVDAVRAVDTLRSVEWVDAGRVAVQGISQGGGIALAAGGLVQGLAAVLADVPFLCDFERASQVSSTDPYGEIARYLQVYPQRIPQVFRTLGYFDGVAFAARATAPAMFSVGGMDPVCPPTTVFAAANAYAGSHTVVEYPYADHAGGAFRQRATQTTWLQGILDGAEVVR